MSAVLSGFISHIFMFHISGSIQAGKVLASEIIHHLIIKEARACPRALYIPVQTRWAFPLVLKLKYKSATA